MCRAVVCCFVPASHTVYWLMLVYGGVLCSSVLCCVVPASHTMCWLLLVFGGVLCSLCCGVLGQNFAVSVEAYSCEWGYLALCCVSSLYWDRGGANRVYELNA
jgi:hypothetical protein